MYSLKGVPPSPGISLSWSVSPAIASISAGNDLTEITLSGTGSGTATLNLQITSPCGLEQVLTKTIFLNGHKNLIQSLTGPSMACNNQYVNFNADPLPGTNYYNWKWPSNWTYVSGQGTGNLMLQAGDSSGSVSVNATSSCDTTGNSSVKYVEVNTCNVVISASPNPISGEVTIKAFHIKNRSTARDKIYKLEVIDIFGNMKKEFSSLPGETNVKINLGTLINGTYIIHGFNGKTWTNKLIQIAH